VALADGTPIYYVTCSVVDGGGAYGISPICATPEIGSAWGGTWLDEQTVTGYLFNPGIPRRIAWSAMDQRYYQITETGLVISFAEGGDRVEEDDQSLDPIATHTTYGVPVIIADDDKVVYLVGYGTGIEEPTTMQPPLCYVKDLNTGTWTIDASITANFVPTTRPVFYGNVWYVGGYTQPTDSEDTKTAAVYAYDGTEWTIPHAGFTYAGSQVRGLAALGQFIYILYDDVVNIGHGIIDRAFVSSHAISLSQNYKIFFSQIGPVAAQQDSLVSFRGNLYTRIFSTTDAAGEGQLWQTDPEGPDEFGAWIDGTWVKSVVSVQELNGPPAFVA
jgi:hypothetical protein